MKKMGLINRELSWLSFNERVLQESMDEKVPLIERMRFLGIYSSNLDEFFRVRVATVRRLTLLKKKNITGFKGDATELLEEINRIVLKQSIKFQQNYELLVKQLGENGIHQINDTNVSLQQAAEITSFYNTKLKHDIVPIILTSQTQFPKLRDQSIYLAVKIDLKEKGKKKFSLIEIPSHKNRFYTITEDNQHYFILLDDIIRLHLASIYSLFEFDNVEAFTFKFTRDAELDLDDDLSISIFEKMEKSVKLRTKGDPVRFVYDRTMPKDLKHYLLKELNIDTEESIIPGGKYHNFKDFASFPDFGNKELIYLQKPPVDHPDFLGAKSLLKVIEERDVLLHFPYQKFDHVVDVLREAAIDPKVKTIKINIYRLANHSQIVHALLNAVSNGKNVVAVIELQARFDEESNMYYAELLKDNGVKVIYGIQYLKIHSKLLYIERVNKDKKSAFAYIGTGNFNESTAKIYTDLALFTHSASIVSEVKKVFELLESNINRGIYKHLLVSPFNNRRKIIALIQREIEHAKAGHEAEFCMKVNNLVDRLVIEKLYKASQEGVKIRLIVRGVCALIPGIPSLSETIKVISIVGRYLEHSRIIIATNNGNPDYFISSADIMERNFDRRIEVGVPILDPKLKAHIQFIFETQWADNSKARLIDAKQLNKYSKKSMRQLKNAQDELANYYLNLAIPKMEIE